MNYEIAMKLKTIKSSQKKISEKYGINKTTISNIVNGNHRPHKKVLESLLDAINKEIDIHNKKGNKVKHMAIVPYHKKVMTYKLV